MHVYMYNVFKKAVAVLGDMSLVVCLRIYIYMYNFFKNAVAVLGDMSLVVCLRIYICTRVSKLQS